MYNHIYLKYSTTNVKKTHISVGHFLSMKSFDYVTRTLHVILKQIIPAQFLQNQNVTYFVTKPESSLKGGGG